VKVVRFCIVVVNGFCCFCFLTFNLFLRSCVMWLGKPLLWAIVIVFGLFGVGECQHSIYVVIKCSCLCSYGWLDEKCMMVSVPVGFL